jgi:hypothetical protein
MALAHFAAGSLDSNERDLHLLARARGVRFCSRTRTLARVRARLFSRQLTHILVVHRPAVADPAAIE